MAADPPIAIAITPDGQDRLCRRQGGNHVTPIDTATKAALRAIKVGHNPFAIAITP